MELQSQKTVYQNSFQSIKQKSSQSIQSKFQILKSDIPKDPQAYIQKYLSYFSDVQDQAEKIINQYSVDQDKIRQHKVLIKQDFLKKRRQKNGIIKPLIQIKSIQHYGTVVNYYIYISKFRFQVSLLNVSQDSSNLKIIGSGGYGQVCEIISSVEDQQKIVAKRKKFHMETDILNKKQHGIKWQILPKKQQIQEYLYEYGFNKLCSFFQIGAKVKTKFGFDLICFQDLIQFYMEECNFCDMQNIERDLKICLKILHKLKIIHKDLKPQNVSYSPAYRKCILFDFGISQQISSQVGQLTFTYKQGTPRYMSPDMSRIKKDKPSKIDLYYNDLYGLKLTLFQLQSKIAKTPHKKYRQSQINVQYQAISLLYSILKYEQKKINMHIQTSNVLFKSQRIKSIISHFDLNQLKEPILKNPFNDKNYLQIIESSFYHRKNKLFSIKQIQFLIRILGIQRIILGYSDQFIICEKTNQLINKLRKLKNEDEKEFVTMQPQLNLDYQYLKSLKRQLIFLQQNLLNTFTENEAIQFCQIVIQILVIEGRFVSKYYFDEFLNTLKTNGKQKDKICLINCLLQFEQEQNIDIKILQKYLELKTFKFTQKQKYQSSKLLIKFYQAIRDIKMIQLYKFYQISQEKNKNNDENINQMQLFLQCCWEQSKNIHKLAMKYKRKKRMEIYLKSLQKQLEYLIFFPQSKQFSDILNEIGYAYKMLGDFSKALQYFQQASYINQQYLKDQEIQLKILWNITECYYVQKNNCEVDRCLKAYLNIAQIYEGEENRHIIDYYFSMGLLCFDKMDFNNALDYCQKALNIGSKLNLIYTYAYANTLHLVGYIKQINRQIKEALAIFKQCLAIKKEVYGCEHKQTVKTLIAITICEQNKNQFQSALEILNICQKIKLSSNLVIQVYNLVATGCYYLSDLEGLKKYSQLSQKLIFKLYGNNSRYCVYAYSAYGKYYWAKKDYKKGMQWFMKALEIKKRQYGQFHFDLIYDLNEIGENYFSIKQYKNAIQVIQKSMVLMRHYFGDNHQKYFELLWILSQCYDNLHKHKKYIKTLIQLQRYLTKTQILQDRKKYLKQIIFRLGLSYWNQQQYQYAIYYYKKYLSFKEILQQQRCFCRLKINQCLMNIYIRSKKIKYLKKLETLEINQSLQYFPREIHNYLFNYYLIVLQNSQSAFIINRLINISQPSYLRDIYLNIKKQQQQKHKSLLSVIRKLQNHKNIQIKLKQNLYEAVQLKKFMHLNRKHHYESKYEENVFKIIKKLVL